MSVNDFYVYRAGNIAVLTTDNAGSYDFGINIIDPDKKTARLALVGVLPPKLDALTSHCLSILELRCLESTAT